MGRRSTTGGVIAWGKGIQIVLPYAGERIRPTLDLEPNAGNLKYARKLRAELLDKIRHGTFDLAKTFPKFAGVETDKAQTFNQYADLFEQSLGRNAAATREDYRKQLTAVWRPPLGKRPIAEIRYSQIQAIIGSLNVTSKTLNNYLIPLRGVFAFAAKDGAIDKNPVDGIENAKVQKPAPDPFTLDEVAVILADLTKHEHAQVGNYFTAAFFAGFRPSELVAIEWCDVDFRRREVRVEKAVVRGRPKDSTKTYAGRDVEVSDRAWEAFEAQRKHTQLAGRQVFWNPYTGQPWADIQTQWKLWNRCLKRVGIRYRTPYEARHTFATWALMEGVNPAWISRQLGHANAQMFFKVYSKWIDGADRGAERGKLNAAAARTRGAGGV
jgi:integrase